MSGSVTLVGVRGLHSVCIFRAARRPHIQGDAPLLPDRLEFCAEVIKPTGYCCRSF